MHIFSAILLILGAIIALVFGLAGVVGDLLERGPYEAPVIEDEGLAWPPRYRGTAPKPQGYGDTHWSGKQESGQT